MKNGIQTLLQLFTGYEKCVTYETLPSCAQVSESFADILHYRHKLQINLHGTMASW